MRAISLHDVYVLLVIGIAGAAAGLPHPLKLRLVGGIASAAYHLSYRKRLKSESNLRVVFEGKLTEAQTRSIIQSSFLESWREIFSWWPTQAELESISHAEVQGLHHVRDAVARRKGAILMETTHFGARGWSKQVLHRHGIQVHQIHVERHMAGFASGPETRVQNSTIKSFLAGREKPFVAEIIVLPQSDSLAYARQLAALLGRNEIVCVSGDGRVGQKHVTLPFLGQQRRFASGTISLARLSGAPVLPLFCLREPGGETRLIIEPPLNLQIATDREERVINAMTQYSILLESYIRKYPGHYRNWQFS